MYTPSLQTIFIITLIDINEYNWYYIIYKMIVGMSNFFVMMTNV